MPKEVIYADGRPYGDEEPAVSIAELSWSRGNERGPGHVQLGTRCVRADDHSPYVHDTFFEYLKPVGEDEKAGVLSMMSGLYMGLDRDGCNDLIRNVRRARDQAFGRDE